VISLFRQPKLAALLLVIILLAPGPLLLGLSLDNAPESYFPEDADAVIVDRMVRQYFPQDQMLVALFSGDDIFAEDFLVRLQTVAEELEKSPHIERVMAVTSADHIEPTEDGFAIQKLLGPEHRTPDPGINRARALNDRFAPGAIVARDGNALALLVRPEPMNDSLQRLRLYNQTLKSIENQHMESHLSALGGHIALDVAQLKAMIRDLATLIPGTLGIALLLLWWLFHRWLVLLASTVCIAAATGMALALLVLLGHPFTLITAIAPPLLTALTVAMLMHLFNAIAHGASRGLKGEARMRSALDEVTVPILFSALTTACGLLSLMASPIRPIATFGLVTAMGTLTGALVIVFLLPPLLLAFDRGPWGEANPGLRRLDRITGGLLRIALRRPKLVLGTAGAVLLAGMTQVPRIIVETDLYAFFADSHPINEATRTIEKNLSGVMPLELVFSHEDVDALKTPARLAAIDRVERWLEVRPEVDYTVSLPNLIEEMHWAFNGGGDRLRTLPDSAPLVEQYLLFYDGDDLWDLVNPAFSHSRIVASVNVHGARALNALLNDLAAELQSNPPADLSWDTSGMGRLFADQERLLIQGQVRSLVAVGAMIALLMLLLWRSPRYAVVSMVPNLAPVALIFSLMGVLGIWLDMATAMVASVAIGIALDDTIHLLHGYRDRRRLGAGTTAALARTVRQRGRAVVATTLVLTAQFLLMTLSPFQPTAIFGALTAVGLLCALLFDLLVLPALLCVIDSRQTDTTKAALKGRTPE
jgi:predicted RND superfamily exporter protein